MTPGSAGPLQKIVDSGQLAGAAALVWRNGAAQTVCVGLRDIEGNLPVERDTMFRIASMTKPITSVAALMLVDEGRIALNDPITGYAPEFSRMRVLRSFSQCSMRPARRKPLDASAHR